MTDPVKRKVSAKEILTDIRSGMDTSELKRKYGLSDKSLAYVCNKLAAAGALTDKEGRRLGPPLESPEAPHEPPAPAQWRCPACNAPQPVEMDECPACGVVVARFIERREQRDHAASIAPRFTRDAEPGGGRGWTSFILSIVVLALIGGALLIWSTHRANEKSKIAALEVIAQPSEEVESESAQPQETADDLQSPSTDYTELKIEDEQGESLTPPEPLVALPQESSTPKAEPPNETPAPVPATPKYVTGVLRQFGSADFKKEVVEASKTYPVLFQFYSNT